MRLAIYGASDDLVEVEIDGKPVEEIGSIKDPVLFHFYDGHGHEKLVVSAEFAVHGWTFTTWLGEDHEDGEPIPQFAVTLSEYGYSQMWQCDLGPALLGLRWGVVATKGGKVVWGTDKEARACAT